MFYLMLCYLEGKEVGNQYPVVFVLREKSSSAWCGENLNSLELCTQK